MPADVPAQPSLIVAPCATATSQQGDAPPAAGPAIQDLAAALQAMEAGHFRSVAAWLSTQTDPATAGLRWWCQLQLNQEGPHLRALRQALAQPMHEASAEVALSAACLLGARTLGWPQETVTRSRQRLTHAAQHLEQTHDHDAAAALWLRVAGLLREAHPRDPALALALAERAHSLAQDAALRLEAHLTSQALRLEQGLRPAERLLTELASLAATPGPLSTAQQARLLIAQAAPLATVHPQAVTCLLAGLAQISADNQPMPSFQAHEALAHAYLERGLAEPAQRHAHQADACAQAMGWVLGHCTAQKLLMHIELRQGQRDQALARAQALAATLGRGPALASEGATLAQGLASLGAAAAGQALIDRVADRLRHSADPVGQAKLATARAHCGLARRDHLAAQHHHRQARRLWRAAGEASAAAEQSLGLAQAAFAHQGTDARRTRFARALTLARADLQQIPAQQRPRHHAALAQLEAQSRMQHADYLASCQHLLEAKRAYVAVHDPINAAFVEALRGLTLRQAAHSGLAVSLQEAGRAFAWAHAALADRLPQPANTMLYYQALIEIEQCSAEDLSDVSPTLLEQACARLLTCCRNLEHHAQSNPLTFDLDGRGDDAGGTLMQQIRALLPHCQARTTRPPPSLVLLRQHLDATPPHRPAWH